MPRSNPYPTGRQAVRRALALLAVCWHLSPIAAADWPQFRGPKSNSIATGAQPPATWSESENIAWRADLPGRGPSSPIVVGDKVVLTCSSGINQNRLHILCFDSSTGKPLWHRQFWATGRTLSHPSSANAAPTPASDGKFVFAFFSSNDLICLDLEGNLKWLRGLAYDFPQAGNDTGMSSSPVVIGDVVIAQVECQGDSFVTGIDKKTGETRWRIDRPHAASWTSPVVAQGAAGQQDIVLLQSPSQLTAHDPVSGRQLWAYQVPCDGISSAVGVDGVVYAASNGTTALRPSSDGQAEVLWNEPRLKPGAASMLVADGRLLMINRAGVLACASTTQGKILWRLRLDGEFWGTPTLVGNRLYTINKDGKGQVVELSADGNSAEVVGTSQLEGTFQCSPAVSEGALYVRSDKHLWKIAAP